MLNFIQMKKLAILGSGELGRQVAHFAEIDGRYKIIGFFDDTKSIGTIVDKYPVIGKMNDIIYQYTKGILDCVFIGIGYDHFNFKEELYNIVINNTIPLATIISPNAYIDPTAKIGNGVILYPGCLIDKDAIIEDNVVINIHTTVAHNSIVGKHSFIAGGATLAGYSSVGKKCFVGVNSVINDHISISDDITIGSLTVVSKNLKQPGIYFNDNRRIFSM